jgi:hypothetical protein
MNITGASNVYFDRAISKEGALVYLPFNDGWTATNGGARGINLTGANLTNTATWKYEFLEEDKDSNLAAGDTITGTVGWTSDKAEVKSLAATNLSGGQYLQVQGTSTTYVGYAESDLGTYVTYDTVPTQDSVNFEYHGGQSYGNIFVSAPSTSVTVTSGSSGAVKSLGSVIYKDSESSSFANNNLVVVGGSCINTAAAELLGSASPICGADFTAKTGVDAGQFLIQTFSRTGGKVATLVAGYNAADTQNAAKYLITQTVDTSAGKKYKGTSATTAEVVTTA